MKKYQKSLTILIIIFCIIAAIRIIDKNIVYDGGKLVEAFNVTAFNIEETQLNIWGEYMPKYLTMNEIKDIGKQIAEDIGIQDYDESIEDTEVKKVYTIEKNSIHANTKIKIIETIELLESGTYRPKNLIMVNLTLYDRYLSIGYFENKIVSIFKELTIDPNKGIIVTASREGKVSELAAREIMRGVIKSLEGDIKEMITNNDLKSAYGYSNHMNEFVISKGEKINMDVAITYNELEEKTYLYAGIPVITFGY